MRTYFISLMRFGILSLISTNSFLDAMELSLDLVKRAEPATSDISGQAVELTASPSLESMNWAPFLAIGEEASKASYASLLSAILREDFSGACAIMTDTQSGISLDERDSFGNTILILAAKKGIKMREGIHGKKFYSQLFIWVKLLGLLLKKGSNPHETNRKGKTAFYYLLEGIKRDRAFSEYFLLGAFDFFLDVLEKSEKKRILDDLFCLCLLKSGKLPGEIFNDDVLRPTLQRNLENDGVNMLEYLIESAVVVDKILEKKDSLEVLLFHAVVLGRTRMVRLLLEKGISPACIDERKSTPLHYAASLGYSEICAMLINKEADVHALDEKNCTPLHRAAKKNSNKPNFDFAFGELEAENYPKVVAVLLQNGASLTARENEPDRNDSDKVYGRVPLHFAAKFGHVDIMAILLDSGADIEATDAIGRTALHFAAFYAQKNVAQLLLSRGANINARDNSFSRQTPWQMAKDEEIKEMLKPKTTINML